MSVNDGLAKPATPAWPIGQRPPATPQQSADTGNPGGDSGGPERACPTTPRRALSLLTRPTVTAIITWLIAAPVCLLGPKALPYSGGAGSVQWLALPLAGGFFAAAVLFLAWLKWPTGWLAGISAGAMAGWFTLILSTALRGTPFPFLGLSGDAGRLTAMATRYTVTPWSSDMMIPGLPSEYPPLFPWIVGRAGALLDMPAWRLVGAFEILFMSLSVLVAFVLWQRLLSPWLALTVTAAAYMAFPIPSKAYEAVALAAFLPWVLLTFMNPPRGRLHWVASGIIAGFIVVAYFGWMIFGAFGVLAIAWRTWRNESNRKAFLLYLAKVSAVAFVVASWFLVPLIYAKVTIGGPTVADLYGSSNLLDGIFPFFEVTYQGIHGLLAIVQLIGLVGLIWLRGRVWWASPLLAMVVGAYAYRLFGAVVFLLTEHTLLSQYTPSVYVAAMSVAAPLTIAHAVPKLLGRWSLTPPKLGAATGIVVVLMFTGYTFAVDWIPGIGGRYNGYTVAAYAEPYPDGTRPTDVQAPTPWFPVEPIRQAVEQVAGADHDLVALSVDERLWAYLPWHGYMGNDLWSSTAHSRERLRDIQDLGAISDPARFAEQSRQMQFGRVDIFVLKKAPEGWLWTFHQGFGQPEANVYFQPAQFDPAKWAVIEVPESYVVIVRK